MLLKNIKEPNDIKNFSNKELNILASEIREFLIENVSKTGGHLASNLGIVELTLALFACFDFSHDKIIFDVGHQCYPYKILTGRIDKFQTLRQYKGISGFPKRAESCFDFFDTGHSSNSISAILGMATARDFKKERYETICVIGDGALTGGPAYEGLNNLGASKSKVILILNDNQMSISKNVGGLSEYLSKIRINKAYTTLKKRVHRRLDDANFLTKFIRKIKNGFKSLIMPSMLFDDLGVRYVGPIDGHNIEDLINILNKAKQTDESVVIHIITKKGNGYKFAEENPNKFHGISPFDKNTGEFIKKSDKSTYSSAFGEAMINIAKDNDNLVALTAAMCDGTGLSKFRKAYPNRFFDVGIAEAHAVSFAAGLALNGLSPVFSVYSSFLQRGFDQVIHDVCMQRLPVIFAIDRAGLVGSDGETHQGVFDISFLTPIPNLTILSPKCTLEIEPMLRYALTLKSPVAIRYPRGGDSNMLSPLQKITSAKWEIINSGNKAAIISHGRMLSYCVTAVDSLKLEDIQPMLINASFIKPLDTRILKKLARGKYNIVVVEDNVSIGGLGNLIIKELNTIGYSGKIKILALRDKFIEHGNIESLLKQEKIDCNSIINAVKKSIF